MLTPFLRILSNCWWEFPGIWQNKSNLTAGDHQRSQSINSKAMHCGIDFYRPYSFEARDQLPDCSLNDLYTDSSVHISTFCEYIIICLHQMTFWFYLSPAIAGNIRVTTQIRMYKAIVQTDSILPSISRIRRASARVNFQPLSDCKIRW